MELDFAMREIERLESALSEAEAETDTLRAQRDEMPAHILSAYRGVEPDDTCDRCGGWGRRSYGSTATWRGGIGGQAMTGDVCDGCWGSGSRSRPWPSHRSLSAAPAPTRAEAEAMLLADAPVAGVLAWDRPAAPVKGKETPDDRCNAELFGDRCIRSAGHVGQHESAPSSSSEPGSDR